MKSVLIACIIVVLLSIINQSNGEAYFIKLHRNQEFLCTILDEETLPKYKGFRSTDGENALQTRMSPAIHLPRDSNLEPADNSKIIEVFARKKSIAEAHLETLCKSKRIILQSSGTIDQERVEILKLVDGGNQSNRIDVVFMGDGYQLAARDQFFDDMRRLTEDMFSGATFQSYLPVFNIWAIYVESVDSGIGYDGPKNTPFRLYREAGQLRVVWPGNVEYARTVCRMVGVSGCDYPSLIGNDDFYGGLGGEFVVSTKSNRTGTVVLRHEMGHNFADVGDEYDNSWAYFGANSANSVSQVGWTNWLTNGPAAREEKAIYRLLEYPWFDLSKGNRSFSFTSDGQYSRWYILLSVSAAGEEDSLEFILDGQVLPWTTKGFDDREFYDWYGEQGLAPGTHTFIVRSKTPPTNPDIPRMICSVTLHEYGNEEEYHMDNDYYSAYPTWGDESIGRVKTLRPTNAGCLMRNMSHPEFCSVCKETMWHQFLQRISLIDGVQVSPVLNPGGTRDVALNTLKLGQLREAGNTVEGERLETKWFKDAVEVVEFRDMFQVEAVPGSWRVDIEFVTPEVRSDPQGFLRESEFFAVSPP